MLRINWCTIKIYPGSELIRQGWNKKGTNVLKEGYGTGGLLPEQGIYLAASVYRPVLQVYKNRGKEAYAGLSSGDYDSKQHIT